VSIIWQILTQFIFRVTFGVATGMAITSATKVSSGFFRVHLWVLMGLNTFAALAVFTARSELPWGNALLGATIAATVLSYIGAVVWLYEQALLGKILLAVTAATGLACGYLSQPGGQMTGLHAAFLGGDFITSGLLLGGVLTAMFLGHWYLNTPGMQLAPLQRLVLFLAVAVVLRSLLNGVGYALLPETQTTAWRLFLMLRWLAGLIGVVVLAGLTWQTLKIPNTQSATGILYAAVILAFIGELTSQLLSAESLFPV